jgi:hypothetical protein
LFSILSPRLVSGVGGVGQRSGIEIGAWRGVATKLPIPLWAKAIANENGNHANGVPFAFPRFNFRQTLSNRVLPNRLMPRYAIHLFVPPRCNVFKEMRRDQECGRRKWASSGFKSNMPIAYHYDFRWPSELGSRNWLCCSGFGPIEGNLEGSRRVAIW